MAFKCMHIIHVDPEGFTKPLTFIRCIQDTFGNRLHSAPSRSPNTIGFKTIKNTS